MPSSTPAQSPAADAPLSTLWKLMEGHRLLYLGAIVTLALATALNYLAPLVGSATLDLAVSGRQPAEVPEISRRVVVFLGGAEFLRDRLWLGAILMAALTAAGGAFSFLKGRFAALAADGIARRQKNHLYDHLQHLPTRYHDRANSGDLVQRCTSDVETVRQCLASQIVEIGNAAILIFTALPLMLMLSAKMTALSFVLVIPIILWGVFYFRRVRSAFREADEAEGRMTSVVQENLTGIRVVRAFARQDFENKRFAGPNADYRDHNLRLIRLMGWYWPTSDLACLSQNGIVLIGGAWMVAHGQLTVGTLFAFMTFLNMLLWPVRQMGRILTDLGKTAVSLGRLGEILAVREEGSGEGAQETIGPETSGQIEFSNVVFAHERATDGTSEAEFTDSVSPAQVPPHALNGVSFQIDAGETVAILGPSGSGKSTLIHLLLRLYDAQSGSIKLDGREVTSLDRKTLRAQFGVVMQEPFLYSKTLRDNIRLARVSASETEVAEAAGIAAIHDTIVGFDHGYDTLIGERGITLSGGQRQRVAIARAVLRDPPVLVLDDALSAVDSETESAIIDALQRRRGKRTTILIAHRLSTLAHADRIVALEHGRVTQIGTHDQLVSADGLYRRLWHIQTNLGTGTGTAISERA